MKLIYHDEKEPKTYEKVYKDCQRGYGIKRPDMISGFMGFFYRLPDVFAYGKAETWAENNEKVVEGFKEFIKRFMASDYGFVTQSEYDGNIEDRWISGTCLGSIGRYSFCDESLNHYGGFVLEFFKDFGLIYSIEEDMSIVYEEQYKDPGRELEIQYMSYGELMRRWKERHDKE